MSIWMYLTSVANYSRLFTIRIISGNDQPQEGQVRLGTQLDIHQSASKLCDAIRLHAQLCETEPENKPDIQAAAAAVTRAVTDYAAAVFSKEGLDIFFAAPSEDPPGWQSLPKRAIESAGPSEMSTEEFIIEDRYTIHIKNSTALSEFAAAATGRDPRSTSEALENLCDRDGWKILAYPEGLLRVNYHATESA